MTTPSSTTTTLSLHLPPPTKTLASSHQNRPTPDGTTTTTTVTANRTTSRSNPPPTTYIERCNAAKLASSLPKDDARRPKLFVPRQLSDFADGGAYPEIHVAQYPRHMGNPHLQRRRRQQQAQNSITTTTKTSFNQSNVVAATINQSIVAVEVDETGAVSYDAIVKGGTNSDKLVYTKLDDMKGGIANPEDITLPTPEEEAIEAERTNAALQAILTKKTAYDKASGSAMINAATSQNIESKTDFIKYTARSDAPGYNPAASTRIIQMVPAKLDPLMPPKHKHIKAPRGPAEDPVPVLHAPPTKLTKEEQEAWKIPTCISNWKNPRGYTIPLDKRLAADGRGLLSSNDVNTQQFAALSESLTIAERQARQEVRLRAITQQKLALAAAEERETTLRQLAQQARMERGGGIMTGNTATGNNTTTNTSATAGKSALPQPDDASIDSVPSPENNEDDVDHHRHGTKSTPIPHIIPNTQQYDTEDAVAARQREKLRMERKRERERELRYEANMELKKKQRLEEERDVSEKIALGVHSTGTGGGIDNVDSRLYNQSSGMDSGFGAEDEYNTYSKPLFNAHAATTTSGSIYRPTRGETEYNADEQYDKLREGTTSKFQPHVGFGGAENPVSNTGPRTEPVQFEKAKSK